MAPRRNTKTTWMISSIICILLTIPCSIPQYAEARISKDQIKNLQHFESYRNIKTTNVKLKQFNHLGLMDPPLDLPNSKSYGVGSPFSLPPFDSLPPTSLSDTKPPECEDSPSTPPPPPSTSTSTPTPTTPTIDTPFPPSPSSPYILTPIFPIQSPPQVPSENPYQSPPFNYPNPPENSPLTPTTPGSPYFVPTPTQSPPFSDPNPPENSPLTPSTPDYIPSPTIYVPAPPEYVPSPPDNIPSPTGYVPGPPDYEPSPPAYVPSPYVGYVPSPDVGYVPSPSINVPSPTGYGVSPGLPVFQPPVLFPPPTGPPSPFNGPQRALWCVVKPSVPDPIIEEAMNYACGSGADCGSIQPQGTCYHPETLVAHASYAFNSYWQRTKAAGGTCDFGGTAILVTIDPSSNGCHFIAT
ncbi:hypothetical protein MKW94_003422 [Papaver nudicaule]|uniref:X8 domain-containing protein n=1 Tax=Papaver nudicaule TaxID=74823 RepID=A0AA41VQC6_PAPNU|nr:hypothetical protein [Papaver nudicaule]